MSYRLESLPTTPEAINTAYDEAVMGGFNSLSSRFQIVHNYLPSSHNATTAAGLPEIEALKFQILVLNAVIQEMMDDEIARSIKRGNSL